MFNVLVCSDKVAFIVSKLIESSITFTCEPMPDDMFDISVKDEAGHILSKYSEADNNQSVNKLVVDGYVLKANSDEDGHLTLTVDHLDGSQVNELDYDIADSNEQWAARFSTEKIECAMNT